MQHDKFAYFLVVRDIEPKEASILMDMMRQEKYFDGALFPDYSEEDTRQKRIFFDCGNKGSIIKIDRPEVEQMMHTLAMAFPAAKFYLTAENLDNAQERYQICTHNDMFQFSELQTYMPKLSKPVPFAQRALAQTFIGERNFLDEFLHKTDFNLLFDQKMALLQARDGKSPISVETIDGLVNFLDFIGDWAENEGFFIYPDLDKEEFLLDSIIQFAQEELPGAGKISYPLSDGKSFINISMVSSGPEKGTYSVKLFQPSGKGFVNSFSCSADLNNDSALRESCRSCLDYFNGKPSPEKPALDSIIASAADRNSSPSSIQRNPSKNIDR